MIVYHTLQKDFLDEVIYNIIILKYGPSRHDDDHVVMVVSPPEGLAW